MQSTHTLTALVLSTKGCREPAVPHMNLQAVKSIFPQMKTMKTLRGRPLNVFMVLN